MALHVRRSCSTLQLRRAYESRETDINTAAQKERFQ